jgi:pyruvate dehydrogenase E1 component
LRRFFEVDCNHIVYSSLDALRRQGVISVDDLLQARERLGLDPDKPDPSKT